MSVPLTTALLHVLVLTQSGAGAPAAEAKLHPYLRQQIEASAAGEQLPVYFVMRDRLRREHFYPRVLRMDKAARRETVLAELRAHMEATQVELVDLLARLPAADATVISRNYLGNFVRARATSAAVLAGAALDGVAEVRYDYVPPASAVQDVGPAGRAPGNGPLDTRAAQVWTRGIRGAGVVWMNSDSGVRASHTSLASVHPGLAGRLWTNPGEVFNNGVDDDGNGKVDDYYGWNFGSNDNFIDDFGGHGTNVTGVFVGLDASIDSTLGNSPGARIMTGALGSEASQWDSVQYALEMGADGQTSSHSYKNYFVPPPDYAMHRDVAEASLAAGLIRTNSTSNDGDLCTSAGFLGRRPFNISAPGNVPPPWLHPDQTLVGRTGGVLGIGAHDVGSSIPTQPSYSPCGPFAWYLPDVLSVNPSYPTSMWDALNDNDYPWVGGSQQGLLKPDLTGPTGTRTTSGGTGYTFFSGTSNATPSVSSCLALALSANPSLTPEDMAMAVQTSAVDYGAPGKDPLSGAGKVDAWELTKLARAIHRVNGDVSHTVTFSASAGGTIDLELDSLPSTAVFPVFGSGPDHVVLGELTVRVLNPVVITTGTTDAQGNYVLSIPLFPGLVGTSAWTQFAVSDPAFGPLTGSNAIHVIVNP